MGKIGRLKLTKILPSAGSTKSDILANSSFNEASKTIFTIRIAPSAHSKLLLPKLNNILFSYGIYVYGSRHKHLALRNENRSNYG